jgi:hypothetical protein
VSEELGGNEKRERAQGRSSMLVKMDGGVRDPNDFA